MEIKNLAALKELKGRTIESPEWFNVTQELVNQFADATKDYQWIHTDPERARLSPFKGPIAHGFYSLSLVPMFMGQTVKVISVKMGVNYGLNKVRFPHHVPVGSRLKCHITVQDIEDYPPGGVKATWQCTVVIEGVDKPACVAEMISLMFE